MDNLFNFKGKETAKVKIGKSLDAESKDEIPNSCDDVENFKLTTSMFLQSLDADSPHEEEQKAIEIGSQDNLNVSKRYERATKRQAQASKQLVIEKAQSSLQTKIDFLKAPINKSPASISRKQKSE